MLLVQNWCDTVVGVSVHRSPGLEHQIAKKGILMKTSLEALFQAMASSSWANEYSGDVEALTGHFAKIVNSSSKDARGVLAEFQDVTSAYGALIPEEIIGFFLVREDSQGFVYVDRYDSETELDTAYRTLETEYLSWAED
jgi:hypothetical protein